MQKLHSTKQPTCWSSKGDFSTSWITQTSHHTSIGSVAPDGVDSRQRDDEDQHSANHQTMHLYTRNDHFHCWCWQVLHCRETNKSCGSWWFCTLLVLLELRAKLRSQTKKTKKPRESVISPICRDASTGAIGLNFGVLGYIADVITHAKFCDNWFGGFGVLIPPILAIASWWFCNLLVLLEWPIYSVLHSHSQQVWFLAWLCW